MRLYRTTEGPVVEDQDQFFRVDLAWDDLINHDDLKGLLADPARSANRLPDSFSIEETLLPPIERQEIWAAGVTYYRSRSARMEESHDAGGSDFYDRVYNADRPELFLKATPHRAVGHGQAMHLRTDSQWIVPEPELTLVINRHGTIVGYTIGNDLSCRDIEGENPLYLAQAKSFDRCAAVGPGFLVRAEPMPPETEIQLSIRRNGQAVFEGATNLDQLKKTPQQLVSYLYRENPFPNGCLLMTGTGVVPPNDFSLQPGDEVRIQIEPIGTLVNRME